MGQGPKGQSKPNLMRIVSPNGSLRHSGISTLPCRVTEERRSQRLCPSKIPSLEGGIVNGDNQIHLRVLSTQQQRQWCRLQPREGLAICLARDLLSESPSASSFQVTSRRGRLTAFVCQTHSRPSSAKFTENLVSLGGSAICPYSPPSHLSF